MNALSENCHNRPVFVGGFPGSGTRVVSRMLSDASVFMGSWINSTNDSVYFAKFLDDWVGRYLAAGPEHRRSLIESMRKDFDSVLARHLHTCDPSCRWGAKNPRFILILPFLHDVFPEMKFVHVLRDGRDLAASPKKRHKIRQYAPALLGHEADTAGDLVELWRAIILRGAGYGESQLRENYFMIKFEDLCRQPRDTILKLCDFINAPGLDVDSSVRQVSPPAGAIGRWKTVSPEFERLSEPTRDVLQEFGYRR